MDATLAPVARARLPTQLAIVFRGCLSFWVAGEISDAALPGSTQAAAILALSAFAAPSRRRTLLRLEEP